MFQRSNYVDATPSRHCIAYTDLVFFEISKKIYRHKYVYVDHLTIRFFAGIDIEILPI